MSESESPGWDAIDAALLPLYAGVEPKHFGTILPFSLGGNDPLQGISAYLRRDPKPHWHFVTYGLSELYEKECDDLEVSGWGFELTFRVACEPDAAEPPKWALSFLQNLGRYVFNSGNVFAAGHYMNLNGPIALGTETAIRSIAFLSDPELPAINTPNGKLDFLQVIGITVDEEMALKQWSTLEALAAMSPRLPLMITDLARTSLLTDPDVAKALREGAERDGSNTGFLFIDKLAWENRNGTYKLIMGARQIIELQALLPFRLPFGRELLLSGKDASIRLIPGTTVAIEESDGFLNVTLDGSAQSVLFETVGPRVSIYRLSVEPELLLEVRKTEIRDQDGKVVETIG